MFVEEHHITSFDPGSFFSLHDYDSSGTWTPDEVRRTYGLDDESARGVSRDKREEVVREVWRLFDGDSDGVITRAEWMGAVGRGVRLPDFGVCLVLLLVLFRGGAGGVGLMGLVMLMIWGDSWGRDIMGMTSMSMRSIILRNFMMRVCHRYSLDAGARGS